MAYRLSRKELGIIERTKREGEKNSGPAKREKINRTLKPYLFFTVLFLMIALGWVVVLYLTR